MARGTTFNNLVEMVREECRRSTNNSRGIDNRDYIERLIKRHYETLYDDYDWQFLKVRRYLSPAAGQRYYDWPSDLDYERHYQISILNGDAWVPIDFGISDADFTAYSSDDDERSDPILKYDFIYTGTTQQLEVWPIPAANLNRGILIRGIKTKTELVSASSRCDLDDIMITLFAASDVLADSDQGAASQRRLAAAQARLSKMRSRNQTDKRVFLNGQDDALRVRGYQRLIRSVYNDRTP